MTSEVPQTDLIQVARQNRRREREDMERPASLDMATQVYGMISKVIKEKLGREHFLRNRYLRR